MLLWKLSDYLCTTFIPLSLHSIFKFSVPVCLPIRCRYPECHFWQTSRTPVIGRATNEDLLSLAFRFLGHTLNSYCLKFNCVFEKLTSTYSTNKMLHMVWSKGWVINISKWNLEWPGSYDKWRNCRDWEKWVKAERVRGSFPKQGADTAAKTNSWKDEKLHRWTATQANICTDEQLHRRTSAQAKSCTGEQLHRRTSAQMNSCTGEQLHRWTAAQANIYTGEQLHRRTSAQMNSCTDEKLQRRTAAQTNSCTDEQLRCQHSQTWNVKFFPFSHVEDLADLDSNPVQCSVATVVHTALPFPLILTAPGPYTEIQSPFPLQSTCWLCYYPIPPCL